MPADLFELDDNGNPIGISFEKVKDFIKRATPFHLDLEHFYLIHYRAKLSFLEELSKQVTLYQILLFGRETTYHSNTPYRPHMNGEICPNRRCGMLEKQSRSYSKAFRNI